MPSTPVRKSFIALALAGVAAEAMALGFGASAPNATLGQPLDHTVSLRLEPGEFVAPECVSAEVSVGEQRLPPTAVRTRLDGEGAQRVLRVQTTSVIDEPVVAVTVAVGCPPRLSRRFVLFADPVPASAPSAPVVASVAPVAPAAAAEPLPEPARVPAPSPSPAPAAEPPAARPAPAVAAPARPRVAVRARAVAPVAQAAAPAAPKPRLKLDPEPPQMARITAELIEAAASAAAAQAAAKATEDAASASAARIAGLEKSIERMRAEAQADRDALRVLRQRAAQGEQAGQWLPWLLGALLLLAGVAGWLWMKLRRLQREQQQAWWNANPAGAATPAATEAPATATEVQQTVAAPIGALAEHEAALAAAADSSGITQPAAMAPVFTPTPSTFDIPTEPPLHVERTQPMPVGWREEPEAPRDVSIEELIDLEQQAEFFIVLGQEDAAVDLLVEHLRSTGGGSPMPYLKLLDIYRRRGDHEAYERTRARFNHRFNAYAPEWGADTQGGRSLEDYPNIVARLQMAWPSPIDAMAELEALLFRKAKGELFDLLAYRDVLFLYSLARDLLDREPLETGNVDVLLPIVEGHHHTEPMSLDEGLSAFDSGIVPLDNPPTVPIDLDVTQPAMPDSLFNEPTDPGIGSRRRR